MLKSTENLLNELKTPFLILAFRLIKEYKK